MVPLLLPLLLLLLNPHIRKTFHSDLLLVLKNLHPHLLVILKTQKNLHPHIRVTTPPEIISYYRLNHFILSLSDNKEASR
jgi:hypothetical protein